VSKVDVSVVYGFVLGRSKELAEIKVPASVTTNGGLKKQFCTEFLAELAGIGPSQFHLELLPSGTTSDEAEGVVKSGKGTKLETTATLAEAGIRNGACVVAVLPAKTIIIHSYDDDTELDEGHRLTVRSQDHLDRMLNKERAHGLGQIDVPEDEIVDQHGKLVDGGHYFFFGDSVTARRTRQLWHQQMNVQLERNGTTAVKESMEPKYGPLAEYTGSRVLVSDKGNKREYDGLLVNSSSVLFIEAKHSASDHHPDLIMDKKRHLEEFLRSTKDPHFKSIPKDGTATIIPFFATRVIEQGKEDMFFKKGIHVVKPNGSNFSVHLANQQPLRQLHSLVRTAKKLLA
jgi:hypothetical protein